MDDGSDLPVEEDEEPPAGEHADVLESSEDAVEALRAGMRDGLLETWLTGSSGRRVAFLTNTERATVTLVAEEGGAGVRAVDPAAEGTSGGYVLGNGQHDTYPDRETVPLGEALRIVGHVVRTGSWPTDARSVHKP